jgi:protein-glucosylgalactosylhydroxylysine glucosidase
MPGALLASPGNGPVSRRDLVARHNPLLRDFDARAPLSVGNGEFAFSADITGLQTCPEVYEKTTPLCTQSQWGWHSFPRADGLTAGDLRLTPFDTFGRQVGYPAGADGQSDLFNWLRQNPHRLHLGRIGFELKKTQITPISQMLDLWSGVLRSRFQYDGREIAVETCCHPKLDLLAVRVRPALAIEFAFPYASPEMSAADWKSDDRHRTTLSGAVMRRELDRDGYFAAVESNGRLQQTAPHRFRLTAAESAATLEFVCRFSRQEPHGALPSPARVFADCAAHWEQFWSAGGAVDLSAGRDPRAKELERRVVLSQYLTAIQCAGSMPPQETGLTCNSWYGKFHLEMHWWHAAHFALWGRAPLLERSMDWYLAILPEARRKARQQGYRGARWPKMVGPEGVDSPSNIGPLLIWQQPHPIALAELCYRAHPDKATLQKYADIVFESAEFMASFAHFDAPHARYVLGPPVIPAQENHPPRETWNPTFELEYWAHGLDLAEIWRRRLRLVPLREWREVRTKLAELPVRDGLYLAHENCPQTFTERNRDHPSMLGAFGVLPGKKVDRETMRRTLRKVLECWKWDETWGWDYPMVAMTAARLGEPELAVEALLMETPKNTWLANGHNWQRANLPLYLPGNGGLLTAVAMMAAAWAGFPKDTWTVRWEGLQVLL